jgi:hypothetical protein
MLIRSDTRQSTVEFVAVAGQEHRGYFHVSASSDGYSLTNTRVFLENTSAFIKDCEAFERSRKGTVVLTGTEDFQFSIAPDGGSGAIWVAVVLNKYFVAGGDRTGHAHSGKMSLEIGFSVAGEHVGTSVQEFRELLTSG